MTQRFLNATEHVFEHEGGYNNKVNDRGGATNWGVSLGLLKSLKQDLNGDGQINYLDIKSLSKPQALQIYWFNFWKPVYDVLPERVAEKVYDTAVNAGHFKAHVLLQKALNVLGDNIATDGMLGEVTLSKCAAHPQETVLRAYSKVQLEFYNAIVARDPSQKEFIKGWTNRANWQPNV